MYGEAKELPAGHLLVGRSGDHRRCGRETFYVGLFGWELEDTEADGGALYAVCRLSGDAVSRMYEIAGDVPATSVAPSWLSYVSVDDADSPPTA